MSTTATLVQLAAELTLFVVVVAGAGLSVRAGLMGLDRPARLLLAAGFAVLAAVAFAVGSLTIVRTDAPVALAAVRCAGSAIVALGALRWAGSRVGRPTLLVGLVLLVVASVAEALDVDLVSEGFGAEPLVLVAALVVGTALVVAGRHTIPGRIGTSVAGVLLAVVLLVSFAVSAVISRTVEDEALRRYDDRAEAEAAAALAEAELSRQEATLVAAGLSAGLGEDLGVATDPDATAADRDAARQRLAAGVADLADGLGVAAPIVVVGAEGPLAVWPTDLASATGLSLAGDPVVQEALEVEGPRQGVTAVGPAAFALAAAPTRGARDGAAVATGVVVVARPLDEAYLARRVAADTEPLSLALVTRDEVAARSGGGGPPADAVLGPGRRSIDTGFAEGGFGDDRVVVARVVAAEDVPPQLALVLSTPSDRVGRTREDLYRSLFLVAMLAGLVGIALSVLLGERIGGGIRLLTAAAARIREGDLTARAAVDREDELGELSSTFDAMAVSLLHLTDDLRVAATEEARLRARLESVFAGVTEAVVAADAEGRVTDLNRAAAELLALDAPSSAVDRPLDEVVALEGLDGQRLALHALGGHPRVLAGHLRLAGADPVPVLGTVAALPVGPDADPAGVVVVLRDIRKEQALEAAKQDFLATIGHELRTPLTPIKGYAGLLRRRPPTPEQAQGWADGISSGVERLEHMVDRLVTFAAATAGAGTGVAHPEEVDLARMVDEVGERWRVRLAGGRDVVVETAGDLPPVRGDEAQLRLAIGELLDNADRFSTPGAPITLRALAVDEDEDVWGAVVVEDAGGDGTAALEDLVGAFQQGESAATRAHDGLGLGLALTDRIATAHGGRVAIATSPEGTLVSILVPVVTEASPARDRPVRTPSPEDDT